jgi:hypothetical protein
MTDHCCYPKLKVVTGVSSTPYYYHQQPCRMAGLQWYGDIGPAPEVERSTLTFEEQQDRYWTKKRHPARGRRPCVGARTSCPWGGCESCLF